MNPCCRKEGVRGWWWGCLFGFALCMLVGMVVYGDKIL